ncbi:MAG TPA: branched-chain amino acid ABC transporter ATP-binding protein/permease [Acetobacteraceae bacterium]|nr:branched-chain amino acid ABC transporter ATP-binding protein/permease [Acetobacteraceae bacterium]
MSEIAAKGAPHPRFRNPRLLPAAVLAAAVLAAIPVFGSAYAVQFGTDILTFTALAYGWNLISGFTGYLSFGQVAFYGLGAYTVGLLVTDTAVPWPLAVCGGGVVGVIAAALLGPVMLRLRGILFALGAFGLARILGVAFSDFALAGGGNGMTLPAELTPTAVYVFMACVALAGFLANLWFARSGFGLDAMAVREDEDAAGALGINTTKVKVVAYILSALFPALVGGLVAWNRSYLDPPSMFDPTIDLQSVVFVLFGGIGTLWGPLLGSVVLMVVDEEFLVHFPDLALLLFGLVVIVTVLLFPGGLVSLANKRGWLLRRPVLAQSALPVGEPPAAEAAESLGPVLEVRNLTVRFGGLTAVNEVSFSVGRGEMLAIIGANGAGKTTLFNTITGFVVPTSGDVLFLGRSVAALPAWRRAQLGMARSFQIPRVMAALTVWENVLVAARHGRQRHRAVAHAAWVVRTVGFAEMWREPVSRLSPGHQRLLEFARVLALNPELVLLDEVMAGMTREEQEEVRAVVRRLREYGVAAVAFVEHVIAAISDLSDRMVVLDFGRKIADDTPARVLADPAVVRAYLGAPQE